MAAGLIASSTSGGIASPVPRSPTEMNPIERPASTIG